ncbi:MAG: 3-hydroxyacyl-ACP dehydratase FabZ [Candidatus Omnitrophota bacterium]|jgi:3-hydroxyacyl-[acyl-carrier-protein] dehydratase
MLNFEQIKKIIPQRFPYLMIDRIVELDEGKRVVGIKNVTGNEICFLGHFPDKAVVPGTMLIEAMAQVATFLFYRESKKYKKLNFYLGIVKDARFFKPVFPGDQLRIEIKIIRLTANNGTVKARVFVDDENVSDGELIFVRRR